MPTARLLAPAGAAEKRLISAPRRILPAPRSRHEITREELIRFVEISEDEILDDLLYPADHRVVRPGASDD
jgi:phosphohistidine phosphatase SixA